MTDPTTNEFVEYVRGRVHLNKWGLGERRGYDPPKEEALYDWYDHYAEVDVVNFMKSHDVCYVISQGFCTDLRHLPEDVPEGLAKAMVYRWRHNGLPFEV
ncbi:MAG: hypothetical protein QMD85_02235 [Candidatus Aenigmarchaeota archaeon]|nr:hypothetical protein [Candidatus Aenigmarchaeota archaeon]